MMKKLHTYKIHLYTIRNDYLANMLLFSNFEHIFV